jgi:hypothetical protein
MNQSAPRMTDCLRLLVYFFVTNNYPKSVYNPHQSTLSTCGALNSSGRCAFVTFMRSKFTGLFFFFFFRFPNSSSLSSSPPRLRTARRGAGSMPSPLKAASQSGSKVGICTAWNAPETS